MTEIITIIVLLIFLFAVITSLANRIPKTGRCFDAAGEQITATITNSNRSAEKAVTIRAVDEHGRKYKAKLKASEAKLWIKGDPINIILSETSGNYRVLFHEYFKENEERIREHALEKLEKTVNPKLVAGRVVGYTKENLEALRASEADSHTVFSFLTYMHMIDVYSVVAVILAIGFVGWYLVTGPAFSQALIPLLLVAIMFYFLNTLVTSCKKMLKKLK